MITPTNSLKTVTAPLLCFVSLCVLMFSITTVQAQTSGTTTGANAAGAATVSNRTTDVGRTPAARPKRGQHLRQERTRTARAAVPQPSPVALVNAAHGSGYLFGQAHVTVKGNEDPVIRLGIAKHGPTVVEFPASDNFFAVHPGGSYLVTYDKSDSLATDHYLVFRAGEGFIVPPENGTKPLEPLASISVQMQSGMFMTFLFYPVSHVSRMAHRCVVSYSREEIVAARRAVGLAVNLDGKEPATPQSQVASTRVSGTAAINTNSPATETTNTASTLEPGASIILTGGAQPEGATGQGRETKRKTQRRRSSKVDVTNEARRAIESALKAPGKFTSWSPAAQGLTVAALAPVELDERYRLTIVAVRNASAAGLRLLPDQPDLDLETLDAERRVAQTRPVQKVHTETSSLAGAIPAGATVYYAIIYESPVLDTQQRLRLSVAHREAADKPASADLSARAPVSR